MSATSDEPKAQYTSAPRIVRSASGRAFIKLACIPGDKIVTVAWGWDGNETAPTVTPSIQCQRCGKHVTVRGGVEQ